MKILRARLFEAERQRVAAQRRLVRNEQVDVSPPGSLSGTRSGTAHRILVRLARRRSPAHRLARGSGPKRFARTISRRTGSPTIASISPFTELRTSLRAAASIGSLTRSPQTPSRAPWRIYRPEACTLYKEMHRRSPSPFPCV